MTELAEWVGCERCDRCSRRIGIVADSWPASTKVVMLTATATRAAQAVSNLDPGLIQIEREVERHLALPASSVKVDYLVACGLGRPTSDHAAACASRFLHQPQPDSVVVLGEETRQLAERAGLIDNGTINVVGAPPIPVDIAVDVEHAIRLVAQRRNASQAPAPPAPSRAHVNAAAQLLLNFLGSHTGCGVLRRRRKDWRVFLRQPLGLTSVIDHLEGKNAFSAYHPRGPWPFVVIDVDVHNAIQAQEFGNTIATIRASFPNAVEVVSSASSGRHFYIRLPDETLYEEAALILQAFFVHKGSMWSPASSKRNGSRRSTQLPGPRVHAQLIEVPVEPPRLPFGPGSSFPGDLRPIADQVQEWVARLSTASSADYDAAKALVFASCKLRGAWNWKKQRKLRRSIELSEVAGLPNPAATTWNGIPLREFSPALRRVLFAGTPSFGTRTRWMLRLARELGAGRSSEKATELVIAWLMQPQHASEDIQTDLPRVLTEARTMVKKEHSGGVPVRIWQKVRQLIDDAFQLTKTTQGLQALQKIRRLTNPQALDLDAVHRTAFEILRMFYRKKCRRLKLHHRHFGRFAGANNAHDVEVLLTHMGAQSNGWLVFAAPAAPGRARVFELLPVAWPLRPREPTQYAP